MTNKSPRQFEELADRLLTGELGPRQLRELERTLVGNTEFQQRLLEYCQFQAMLSIDQRAEKLVDELCTQRAVRISTKQEDATRQPVETSPAMLKGSLPSGQALTRSALFAGSIAATIAIVVLGTLTLLQPAVDMGPIASSSTRDASLLPKVTTVKTGDGTTQLALSKIGLVTLQGPSDFELLGPRRARLTKGRIKFRVTDIGGRGFVVETPDGEITDIGTEFGVDVGSRDGTGLVVFEGEVDLRVPTDSNPQPASKDQQHRLVEGEGVVFSRGGRVDRIMSIFTKDDFTFSRGYEPSKGNLPVIIDARDNLRTSDTLQFYEIVPGGMREDARAYVDRPAHQWNGVDERGMPPYLLGADYVKPFNNDKFRKNFELQITLSVPSQVYVFFDDRLDPPQWLRQEFEDTGDDMGIDMGPWRSRGRLYNPQSGRGPGVSIENALSIWRRKDVAQGKMILGPNKGNAHSAMYGICAVAVGSDETY